MSGSEPLAATTLNAGDIEGILAIARSRRRVCVMFGTSR